MTGYTLTMKRRTLDGGCVGGAKQRRPVGLGVKKTKLSDGFYSNLWLYLKFLLIWAIVLTADFIVEFRFEFLWPVWLLIRSTYDSFRYQGLAFSVLFVCISLTSDIICYLFVPVQWLLLAASTYVWVQYVWHTERGLCLLNFFLLLLFFGTETSTRLRDVKCLPFHWDLCRPFAAHCIGYPVVTLGFGCKSYISYKLRLRKQTEVQKQNEFYFELLQKALPADTALSSQEEPISLCNGGGNNNNSSGSSNGSCNGTAVVAQSSSSTETVHKRHTTAGSAKDVQNDCTTSASTNSSKSLHLVDSQTSLTTMMDSVDSGMEFNGGGTKSHKGNSVVNGSATMVNDYKPDESGSDTKVNKTTMKQNSQLNGSSVGAVAASLTKCTVKDGGKSTKENSSASPSLMTKNNLVAGATSVKSNGVATLVNKKLNNTANKDDAVIRLEMEIKRVKADLQASRSVEQELRSQINGLTSDERSCKAEVYQLRQDNENLQSKLHNLTTSRQQDKQSIATLERKLAEERKQRAAVEQQLTVERKKKQEELASARAAQPVRIECSDPCKTRRSELEGELQDLNWDLKHRLDQIQALENEVKALRQNKDSKNESELLMSALMAIQDKNAHLENNLSSETRIKMDLFSALGEAKRHIEIQHNLLQQRDAEVADLKTKIAEVMALVPSATSFNNICTDSPPHFSTGFPAFLHPHHHHLVGPRPPSQGVAPPTPPSPANELNALAKSNLNPKASDYQPKPGSPM